MDFDYIQLMCVSYLMSISYVVNEYDYYFIHTSNNVWQISETSSITSMTHR